MSKAIFNFLLICLFTSFGMAYGRVTAEPDIVTQMKNAYPGQYMVHLKKEIKYVISLNDQGLLDVTTEHKDKYIYLKNIAVFNTEQSVFTSHFRELVSFEANSYLPQKNKFKKVPVESYKEKQELDNSIFFSDTKELVFTFDGISEGAIIELNTLHKLNEPRFLNQVFFQSSVPVHEFECNIVFDDNITIDIVEKNMNTNLVAFKKQQKDGQTIYTWQGKALKELSSERFQPDIRYFAPHILPLIRGYVFKGNEIELLKNSDELYKWYYGFIQDLDNEVDVTALKQIADSVTVGTSDELEKVKRLYYWVQKNIKYIAFENGMGGLIPRKADLVLQRRFGDCKDKSSILHTLMKLSGIEGHFTWIGSDDIPYEYNEIPSPVTDNHMIITYYHNGKPIFLDGTGSFQDFEYPTAFIQGKEALVSISKDEYRLEKVPVMAASKNLLKDEATLKLDGKKLMGEGILTLEGYNKINFQNKLLQYKDQEDIKTALEAKLEKGSNKFILEDYTLGDLMTFDARMSNSYHFSLDDYVTSFKDELFINMNLDRGWLYYKLDDNRKNPVRFENKGTFVNTYTLHIPEGYAVEHIPEQSQFENDYVGLSVSYTVNDNSIVYHQTVVIKDTYLEGQALTEWKNFIMTLEKTYKQTLGLKKI